MMRPSQHSTPITGHPGSRRISLSRSVCLVTAALLCILSTCSTTPRNDTGISGGARYAIPDSLSLQESCTHLSQNLRPVFNTDDSASLDRFNRAIDSAASVINNCGLTDKRAIKDSILATVYTKWKIGFDPRDTILETLLPHLVFRNRKGACMGVSLIILMLAEKVGCPVYGVLLPGHFFCRFDDGTVRINIEPNRLGHAHPDDYYRERYPVDRQPWYDLCNLPKKASIGAACYNAGVICLSGKLFDPALSLFSESIRRIPEFKEARANRALTFAKKGVLDSAMTGFDALFRADPGLINLAVNYGTVAIAVRDCRKALQVFQRGLSIYPSDRRLLSGVAQAYACLGMRDSAKAAAARIRP
jgi:hypothetical protein